MEQVCHRFESFDHRGEAHWLAGSNWIQVSTFFFSPESSGWKKKREAWARYQAGHDSATLLRQLWSSRWPRFFWVNLDQTRWSGVHSIVVSKQNSIVYPLPLSLSTYLLFQRGDMFGCHHGSKYHMSRTRPTHLATLQTCYQVQGAAIHKTN
jgi:hypothetical protein